MCGIVGKVDFSGRPVPASLIEAMAQTLVHRGPDDQHVYTADGIGLGQRRLAIIDLDPRAAAPLCNEDRSVWVTFNGEIYNFADLRRELLDKGHHFRSEGDTEVLVHLYEEHGVDLVHRLRGMFAFAIWDAPRRRLFAARDRLGKKPFIYAKLPGAFLFGSEIKAVLADPSVSREPDFSAIDAYLTHQYIPSPLSAFKGVAKLPPAHLLLCDAATGEVVVKRYWSPPLSEKTAASEEEVAAELRERLRESVRLRLVADVPVGAFLSGGVDSGAVVAMMAELSSTPVKTFTVGFENGWRDELPHARRVAERYGTDHHEIILRPSAAEVLPVLVRHYDEPFADSSALPSYYVAKVAREHVTVALSGDGGDENFAGYRNYASVIGWSRADVLPPRLRRAAATFASATFARFPSSITRARAHRAAAMFAGRVPERFLLQQSIFKPEEKASAYTAQMRALVAPGAQVALNLPWSDGMDALDWMMRHDQCYYLADCLMVKTDIASMANSLEVRSPLLDHTFVEFTATIPSSMKRTAAGAKAIFKKAVADLLPPETLAKGKTGFGLPVADWFRGELAPLVRETLLDDRARTAPFFDRRFVRSMFDAHLAHRRDWSNRLWALLFLELWFREYID